MDGTTRFSWPWWLRIIISMRLTPVGCRRNPLLALFRPAGSPQCEKRIFRGKKGYGGKWNLSYVNIQLWFRPLGRARIYIYRMACSIPVLGDWAWTHRNPYNHVIYETQNQPPLLRGRFLLWTVNCELETDFRPRTGTGESASNPTWFTIHLGLSWSC